MLDGFWDVNTLNVPSTPDFEDIVTYLSARARLMVDPNGSQVVKLRKAHEDSARVVCQVVAVLGGANISSFVSDFFAAYPPTYDWV